jgi:hypothetical protein
VRKKRKGRKEGKKRRHGGKDGTEGSKKREMTPQESKQMGRQGKGKRAW